MTTPETAPAVAVVFNPVKTEKDALTRALDRAGVPVDEIVWFETTPEDAGQGMAGDALAAGAGLVIAAGGDGTVRAVAERLAGTGTPLGIVPRGTGNLLARTLEIPLNSVDKAVARAVQGDDRPIDIAWVEIDGGPRQAFVVMAGFGIDARMLEETDENLKDKAGWLAYVDALGRAVRSTENVEAKVAFDDGEATDATAHTVMIGNCGMIQGGVRLMPDAQPDDGFLDVMVVGGSGGPAQWIDAIRSVVWDNGIRRLITRDDETVDTDSTSHRQVHSVRIELPEPQPFQIDGEEAGSATSIAASIDPGALLVR